MKFKELKEYFESNELPQTLVVFGQWHGSVQVNIKESIEIVESEIELLGVKGVRKSKKAPLNVHKLKQIHLAMKDKANWNMTREEWVESRKIKFLG